MVFSVLLFFKVDCYIEALVENADDAIPQGSCTFVLYETSIFCGILSPCGSCTFTMQSRGNCNMESATQGLQV